MTIVGSDQLAEAFGRPPAVAPITLDHPRAAVAAIFRRSSDGTELLFIERATRDGDPWSGQMALPGGRVDRTDVSSSATAERETREEIGVDLTHARRLGRLDDFHGGGRPIIVTPHGYWWDGAPPELRLNHEVAAALWVPLQHLGDPSNRIDYVYPPLGDQRWPGIAVPGDRVVWGLTLRLLNDLFSRLPAHG